MAAAAAPEDRTKVGQVAPTTAGKEFAWGRLARRGPAAPRRRMPVGGPATAGGVAPCPGQGLGGGDGGHGCRPPRDGLGGGGRVAPGPTGSTAAPTTHFVWTSGRISRVPFASFSESKALLLVPKKCY